MIISIHSTRGCIHRAHKTAHRLEAGNTTARVRNMPTLDEGWAIAISGHGVALKANDLAPLSALKVHRSQRTAQTTSRNRTQPINPENHEGQRPTTLGAGLLWLSARTPQRRSNPSKPIPRRSSAALCTGTTSQHTEKAAPHCPRHQHCSAPGLHSPSAILSHRKRARPTTRPRHRQQARPGLATKHTEHQFTFSAESEITPGQGATWHTKMPALSYECIVAQG